MLKFNQLIKYDSYMWNYVRLAPKFYKEFLVQMTRSSRPPWTQETFRWTTLSRGSARILLRSSKTLKLGWTSTRTLRRTAPLGRAKYYASVGGPGVVAAFLIESLRG